MTTDELAARRRSTRTRGRPSKLTPERRHAIVRAILTGNYFATACEYAGIDPGTGHRWLSRGEGSDPEHEPTEPYITFSREVREAQAVAEMHKVAIISAAAQESWQAAAWWLERTAPARWGRRDRLTAEIEVRGQIEHTVPPPRSAARLTEMVRLAQELGIVRLDELEAGTIIDGEVVEE